MRTIGVSGRQCCAGSPVLPGFLSLIMIFVPLWGFTQESAGEDFASLSGIVTWGGESPVVDPLPVTKNPEVCGHESKASPRLVVNADNRAVKNVVVWLEDMPEGFETTPEPQILDQKDCEYIPHIVMVPKREYFQMRSSDDILHNIHATGALRFNKPFPIPGVNLKERARKAGIAELNCDAGHVWMSAFVFVTEHPYYAVTDDDGRFEITGIPPGEHTLVVWHEGWTIKETETEPDGTVKQYHFDEPKTIKVNVTLEKGGAVSKELTLTGDGFSDS